MRVAQQANEIEDDVGRLLSADDPQIVSRQGVEGEDRRKGQKIRIVHLALSCLRPLSFQSKRAGDAIVLDTSMYRGTALPQPQTSISTSSSPLFNCLDLYFHAGHLENSLSAQRLFFSPEICLLPLLRGVP